MPDQPRHVLLMKNIPHQTVAFAQMQLLTITGDDPGGVLPTMLKDRQRIVELMIDRLVIAIPTIPHMLFLKPDL